MGIHLHITMALACLYSIFIFVISRGLKLQDKKRFPLVDSHDPVTVVVPYRNERNSLPGLISDLSEQSSNRELYQVILVNDHSSDGSEKMVQELTRGRSGFHCVDLPLGRKGKKEALALGVETSTTRWIIQTDADCRIGPHFIKSHMSYLSEFPSDLVAGVVTSLEIRGSLLESFERLDLLGLSGVGGGSFYYRRALMCSGANLAYSRSLFKETRGFDPVEKVASGDDMFLMVGGRKKGRVLSFLPAREAIVRTAPVKNLGSMIRQRIRWGAKAPYYKMADIQGVAVLTVFTNLMLFLLPLWIILTPGKWPWLVGAIGIKTTADLFLLFRMTAITGQRRSLRKFLPAVLVYYPFQFMILIASLLNRNVNWKEEPTA